jgi:tetratricopeptide (TPR) repeat protein
MLVNGRWKYADAGILDRTHLRFFTAIEIAEMVREVGLEVATLQPLSMVDEDQLPRNDDGSLTIGRMTIQDVSDRDYAEFRVYQYMAVGVKIHEDSLNDAEKALTDGENERAYDLAKKAVAANRRDRTIIMAKATGRLGNLSESEHLYQRLLSENADDYAASGELGIILIAENRIDEARPYLEQGLRLEPPNGRTEAGMGLVHLTAGDSEEAYRFFKRALEINLEQESIIPHLIDVAKTLNRFEEIQPLLQRYVNFYPGKVDVGCRYARVLMSVGHEDQARDCLKTILLLAPENTEAQSLMKELA